MYKHLYDIFRHWYHGGTVYFYSDPHFSDPEMKYLRKNYIGDEEQVKRINRVVGKNDTIIFLGDIHNIEFIRKIRGYKVLIQGNHDTGATNYKKTKLDLLANKSEFTLEELKKSLCRNYPKYKFNITFTSAYWHIELDDCLFDEVYEGPLMISEKILLSHEPIDLPFVFNICGHDHSNTQFKDDRHYNMCAEHINYTPVCIKEIINSGKLKNIDSIHRQTIDKATERKKKRNE